ncbi:hypothetical protein J4H86_15710 [Spiractinospora alimapuensis]|uniref:hypothetical protein n=1 Tax=Spiractinospora alimapuensis TaxID=2820884 RepID=UPI001F1BD418|nr:hypothetical protein [Spiractinospora alimapuensis]QVQ50377.1 hypothetical protein J4H86_15710 [Spiractinospora alimapuensis]
MNAPRYPYLSQFAADYREQQRAEGLAEGLAEGQAEARAADVVRILEKRRVTVDAASRERILGCTDLHQLTQWFDRAITVEAVSELFS